MAHKETLDELVFDGDIIPVGAMQQYDIKITQQNGRQYRAKVYGRPMIILYSKSPEEMSNDE
jgi:hypothetical protein